MKKVLTISALAALVAAFVALAISNFSLRRQLKEASSRGGRTVAMFKTGDMFPRFEARDRADRKAMLGGASSLESVIVLVHPRCKYCGDVLHDIASRQSVPGLTVVSIAPKQLSAKVTDALPAAVPAYFVDHIEKSPLGHRTHGV